MSGVLAKRTKWPPTLSLVLLDLQTLTVPAALPLGDLPRVHKQREEPASLELFLMVGWGGKSATAEWTGAVAVDKGPCPS